MTETILATVLATLASAVVLAYLSRTLVTRWLDKDLASYKTHLSAEHARELEQYKASLARASADTQGRVTRSHERRARVITRLYAKLDRLYRALREWTRTMRLGQRRDMSKLRDGALAARSDLLEYYWRNTIWLEQGMCDALTEVIGQLDEPSHDLMVEVDERGSPNDRKAWLAAVEKVTKDIPKARLVIERRFRAILGDKESATSGE